MINYTPTRSKEAFLVFGLTLIEEQEIKAVASAMKSGWLGTGPKVAQFEKDFASYKGAKFLLRSIHVQLRCI